MSQIKVLTMFGESYPICRTNLPLVYLQEFAQHEKS